jgi:hypothetical protein
MCLDIHHNIALCTRCLEMPLKVVKTPSKTFQGIFENAGYKILVKGLLRHFSKMLFNINI